MSAHEPILNEPEFWTFDEAFVHALGVLAIHQACLMIRETSAATLDCYTLPILAARARKATAVYLEQQDALWGAGSPLARIVRQVVRYEVPS